MNRLLGTSCSESTRTVILGDGVVNGVRRTTWWEWMHLLTPSVNLPELVSQN